MSEQSQKVPSQIFRWFEKMKSNYEQSVQQVLARFENYNTEQQNRIDLSNKAHLADLKQLHQQHKEQQSAQIKQQQQEISYFKDQVAQQQQTILQLNSRYDAVMSCLLAERKPSKDIFDDFDIVEQNQTDFLHSNVTQTQNQQHTEQNNSYNCKSKGSDQLPPEESEGRSNKGPLVDKVLNEENQHGQTLISEQSNGESLYLQAMNFRDNNEYTLAFTTFEQAAKLGHVKAMGAIGRAFFLNEGTDEDIVMGLAWLIKAAENDHPQAIKRVAEFKLTDPELYQLATVTKQSL